VIFCRACEIGLPDQTVRCPMCQRHLRLPVRLITAGAALFCVLLSGLLWGPGRLANRAARWEVRNEDVLRVAQSLIAGNPALRNPVGFSAADQTTVEHWDGRRWRVSGYVDTRPPSGVKVRTLYFVVLQNNGKTWDLEDLQLQSMAFDTGPRLRRN
jgi:hypothetical protein